MASGFLAMVDRYRGELLRDYMQRTGNNVSAAARMAGVNRTHFHRLLRLYAPELPRKQVPAGNAEWRAMQ